MPTKFPSMLIDSWPDQARERWSTSRARHEWPTRYRHRIASAYGRLLAHAGRPDIGDDEIKDAVDAFCADVEASLKPSSAITYAEELVYALVILHPDVDWTPLQARNRDRRAALRRAMKGSQVGPTRDRNRLDGERCSKDQRQRLAQSSVRVSDLLRRRAKSSQWTPRSKRQPAPAATDGHLVKNTATWSPARRSAIFATWDRYQRMAAQHDFSLVPSPDSLDAFVKAVVGENPDISDVSLADYVGRIYVACRSLYPEQGWGWLKHDWRAMTRLAQASRDKRAQFVPIEKLYLFGIRLMHRAFDMPRTVEAATMYRDGLFIALLALRPKRRSNITSLKVGGTLLLDANGIPEKIVFARTKNGAPSTTPYPSQHLGAYHDIWWQHFRPILLGDRLDRGDVWIGKQGEAVGPNQLWRQMRKRTGAPEPVGLGIAIGVHIVRTIYATSMAEATSDPTLLRLTPWMLDHRDPGSIEPYNMQASGMAAAAELERAADLLRVRDQRP